MPQVINTVTKAAPTDNYPVVFDTDLSGSYRIVANLTVRDAIVSTQRKQGMLVFVLSDLHFYSLQSDLLTWTDLGTSLGGGFAPPIVRYVYLVADSSDAARMGGTPNNTYLTFQTAYAAADALQIALGAASFVVIKVGQTLLTQNVGSGTIVTNSAGDLTLTANYNTRIVISGEGVRTSVLGNIIATNASGNGFSVGTSIRFILTISNLSIGNISTNATGATGNSGGVSLSANACQIGNITTAITNVANTTGVAGAIRIATNSGTEFTNVPITSSTSLTSTAQGALGSAGGISVIGRIKIGNITAASNNIGGGISLSDGVNAANIVYNTTNTTPLNNATLSITNATIGTLTASLAGTSIGGSITSQPNFIINSIVSELSVIHNGLTAEAVLMSLQNSNFTKYASNTLTKTLASLCTFEGVYNGSFNISLLTNVGNDSVFNSCSFICANLSNYLINGIGTNCSLIGCSMSIQGIGGNKAQYSIYNSNVPVTVMISNTILAKGRFGIVSGGVSLMKLPVPTLTDSGTGQFNWDTAEYQQVRIDLNGLGGGNNVLFTDNLTIGETYIVYVQNLTGTDTVTITDSSFSLISAVAQAGSTGGTYTPTPIVGAVDRLMITFDGTVIWTAPAGQDFQT